MFLLLLLSAAASAAQMQQQWSLLSPSSPPLLSTDPGAKPVSTGNTNVPMWCVGGDVYVLQEHLWKYETDTGRWLWQPDVPIAPRTAAAQWTVRGKLYVYGGVDQNGTMWTYDPRTRVSTYIGGFERSYGMAYWSHEQSNRLYVWGGASAAADPLRAFDVTTNTWTSISFTGGGPDRTPYGGAATVSGNTAYVYNNDRLWSLNLNTFAWTQVPMGVTTPPGPSRVQQVIAISTASGGGNGGNGILLYGGVSGSKIYSDTWLFSVSSSSWTLISDNAGPPPRQGFSTCVNANSSLILFSGGGDFNDLWVYGPTTELTVFQKLEVGLKSAILWSFASAVLSGMVLLCFVFFGAYVAVKRCKNGRERRGGGGLASTVNLKPSSHDDFSHL